MANTLDTSCNQGVIVKLDEDVTVYAIWYPKYECYIAIRKLTPKECFRLQGWTDDYFEKAQFVNSDSQLYKQAGNGVTVNVVYEIAKRLECENGKSGKVQTEAGSSADDHGSHGRPGTEVQGSDDGLFMARPVGDDPEVR